MDELRSTILIDGVPATLDRLIAMEAMEDERAGVEAAIRYALAPVEPRFLLVEVVGRQLRRMVGRRLEVELRCIAGYEDLDERGKRLTAHGSDSTVLGALRALADSRAGQRRPVWVREGLALEVVVCDRVHRRTSSGRGQTVGEALRVAIAGLELIAAERGERLERDWEEDLA